MKIGVLVRGGTGAYPPDGVLISGSLPAVLPTMGVLVNKGTLEGGSVGFWVDLPGVSCACQLLLIASLGSTSLLSDCRDVELPDALPESFVNVFGAKGPGFGVTTG